MKVEIGALINSVIELSVNRWTTAFSVKKLISDSYHLPFLSLQLFSFENEVSDNEIIRPSKITAQNQFTCKINTTVYEDSDEIDCGKETLEFKEKVEKLIGLGFTSFIAKKALNAANGDYENAITLLDVKLLKPKFQQVILRDDFNNNCENTQNIASTGSSYHTTENSMSQNSESEKSKIIYVAGQQVDTGISKIVYIDVTKHPKPTIPKVTDTTPWTEEEDQKLIDLYSNLIQNKDKFVFICKHLEPHSKEGCISRYEELKKQYKNKEINYLNVPTRMIQLWNHDPPGSKKKKKTQKKQTTIAEINKKENIKESDQQETKTEETVVINGEEQILNQQKEQSKEVHEPENLQIQLNNDEQTDKDNLKPNEEENLNNEQNQKETEIAKKMENTSIKVIENLKTETPIETKPKPTGVRPLPDYVIDIFPVIRKFYELNYDCQFLEHFFPDFAAGYLVFLMSHIKMNININRGTNTWSLRDMRKLLELSFGGLTDPEVQKLMLNHTTRQIHDKKMRLLKDIKGTRHLMVFAQVHEGFKVPEDATYDQNGIPSYLDGLITSFNSNKKNRDLLQSSISLPDLDILKTTEMVLRERKPPKQAKDDESDSSKSKTPVPWTEKEDQAIIDGYAEFKDYRDKWVRMVNKLPGRTTNQISSRFRTISDEIKKGLKTNINIPKEIEEIFIRSSFNSLPLPSISVNFPQLVYCYFGNNCDINKTWKDFSQFMKGYLFFVLLTASQSIRRINNNWEKKEERVLFEMYYDGFSILEISKQLNKSIEQIQEKIAQSEERVKMSQELLKKVSDDLVKSGINIATAVDADGLPVYFKETFRYYIAPIYGHTDTTNETDPEWTKEEEQILINKYSEFLGNKNVWKLIAEVIPRHQPNQIMRYFKSLLDRIKQDKCPDLTVTQQVRDLVEAEKKLQKNISEEDKKKKIVVAVKSSQPTQKIPIWKRKRDEEGFNQEMIDNKELQKLKPLPDKQVDILHLIKDFYEKEGDDIELQKLYPDFSVGYLVYLLDWTLRQLSKRFKSQSWNDKETRFVLEKHFDGITRSRIGEVMTSKNKFQIGSKSYNVMENLNNTNFLKEFAAEFQKCPGIESSKYNDDGIPSYLPPMIQNYLNKTVQKPKLSLQMEKPIVLPPVALPPPILDRQQFILPNIDAIRPSRSASFPSINEDDPSLPIDFSSRVSFIMNMGYPEKMTTSALKLNDCDIEKTLQNLNQIVKVEDLVIDQCHPKVDEPKILGVIDSDGELRDLKDVKPPPVVYKIREIINPPPSKPKPLFVLKNTNIASLLPLLTKQRQEQLRLQRIRQMEKPNEEVEENLVEKARKKEEELQKQKKDIVESNLR
ncbi:Myb-like DNA-binding domain containing protein [Trichomonas vaginalis G3]|uniref:Myb-like DNA-binding domain containing protein n=1 Tax=Trichomonas vaginalis (strain ATCC PRA-98 / G3) TaxID=412133 RepID=A2FM34_TRIV3|nr:MYB protein-related family [Trichomonas vaginalis G3]EAX94036.1 Myb-like DNA-binding domain containing protein [Trichomonas vaginalis G3]KAI5494519.1 MYB protein-related family [Trichomonas vaginalis G3]|eukprot:XP_001306966.1 Myb-like DNA-binding domain containing protein [Trichomonas vaginalis G3]